MDRVFLLNNSLKTNKYLRGWENNSKLIYCDSIYQMKSTFFISCIFFSWMILLFLLNVRLLISLSESSLSWASASSSFAPFAENMPPRRLFGSMERLEKSLNVVKIIIRAPKPARTRFRRQGMFIGVRLNAISHLSI